MCIIIVTEEYPTLDLLKECESSNKDGGGIAWRENGKIHWKKGLTAQEVFDITQVKSAPFAIHFRIATVGPSTPAYTHPFPTDGSLALEGVSDRVLFHNGTWKDWQDKVWEAIPEFHTKFPDQPWSDSRAMAWLTGVYGPNILNIIEGYQKIYLFDVDPEKTMMIGKWEDLTEKTKLSHSISRFNNTTTAYNHGLYDYDDYGWSRTGAGENKWSYSRYKDRSPYSPNNHHGNSGGYRTNQAYMNRFDDKKTTLKEVEDAKVSSEEIAAWEKFIEDYPQCMWDDFLTFKELGADSFEKLLNATESPGDDVYDPDLWEDDDEWIMRQNEEMDAMGIEEDLEDYSCIDPRSEEERYILSTIIEDCP